MKERGKLAAKHFLNLARKNNFFMMPFPSNLCLCFQITFEKIPTFSTTNKNYVPCSFFGKGSYGYNTNQFSARRINYS